MKEPEEPMARLSSAALDEIIGRSFSVLNDGFVRVVDYLGCDGAVVQAARVSYGRGTKKVSQDRALIRYLMRHGHTTPFEMCEIKMHVRVPMDTWRQWIRHRTANVNEYSTRYSLAIDAFLETPYNAWRGPAMGNKQGSEGVISDDIGRRLTAREQEVQALAREVYAERIDLGVAREQARKDLPLSTYTEAYWKIDLHNLLHFLELRMRDRAQWEIRQYANIIGFEVVARWCPLTWQAFCDYRLDCMVLSGLATRIMSAIISGRIDEAKSLVIDEGLLLVGGTSERKTRELQELEANLRLLGIEVPW
jgi:thymidylate synthase (FAD)